MWQLSFEIINWRLLWEMWMPYSSISQLKVTWSRTEQCTREEPTPPVIRNSNNKRCPQNSHFTMNAAVKKLRNYEITKMPLHLKFDIPKFIHMNGWRNPEWGLTDRIYVQPSSSTWEAPRLDLIIGWGTKDEPKYTLNVILRSWEQNPHKFHTPLLSEGPNPKIFTNNPSHNSPHAPMKDSGEDHGSDDQNHYKKPKYHLAKVWELWFRSSKQCTR